MDTVGAAAFLALQEIENEASDSDKSPKPKKRSTWARRFSSTKRGVRKTAEVALKKAKEAKELAQEVTGLDGDDEEESESSMNFFRKSIGKVRGFKKSVRSSWRKR